MNARILVVFLVLMFVATVFAIAYKTNAQKVALASECADIGGKVIRYEGRKVCAYVEVLDDFKDHSGHNH